MNATSSLIESNAFFLVADDDITVLARAFHTSDANIQSTLNSSLERLYTSKQSHENILNKNLSSIRQAVDQYASKNSRTLKSILQSKRNIKYKKIEISRVIDDIHQDIDGFIAFFVHYQSLVGTRQTSAQSLVDIVECIDPILSVMEFTLNEMIKLNSFENQYKDQIKKILGYGYHQKALNYLIADQAELALPCIINSIEYRDGIRQRDYRTEMSLAQAIMNLAATYVKLNRLEQASNILSMERDRIPKEITCSYFTATNLLARKYAKIGNFSNALYWIQEAKHSDIDNIIKNEPDEYAQNHIQNLRDLLESSNRCYHFDAAKLTIHIEHSKWTIKQKQRIHNIVEHNIIELIDNAIVFKKFQRLNHEALKQFLDAVLVIENELLKLPITASSSTQPIYDSAHSQATEPTSIEIIIEDFKQIQLQDTIPSPAHSESASSTNCITPAFQLKIMPKTAKIKTRGSSSQQSTTKALPQSSKYLCDADRLGFSKEIFSTHSFSECRMRGDTNQLFYTVAGRIDSKSKQAFALDAFGRILSAPKIVPPTGEAGFKWMNVKGQQVLVGKILGTKKRLFPTAMQANANGAIAFLYGTLVNTKNGYDNVTVKNYTKMTQAQSTPATSHAHPKGKSASKRRMRH